MSYPLEPIDLLIDVSKVLYNERIVEQRKQIKDLKLCIDNIKSFNTYYISASSSIFLSNYHQYIKSSLSMKEVMDKWIEEFRLKNPNLTVYDEEINKYEQNTIYYTIRDNQSLIEYPVSIRRKELIIDYY